MVFGGARKEIKSKAFDGCPRIEWGCRRMRVALDSEICLVLI